MLNVTDITITDSIEQLATSCKIEIASAISAVPPAAEIIFSGDTARPTSTTIRPNGTTIEVQVGINEAPYTIFTGQVEFMDDLEDANQSYYTLDLSNTPPGQPHKTQVTMLINGFVTNMTGEVSTEMSAHEVLSRVCRAAGIGIGRIDLPDYKVWGSWEIIRQNAVEVAHALCQPFNTFPHTQYFPRCDRNGMQIIKIDYTLGGEVANIYEVDGPISTKRQYEQYRPQNRIGASETLLTGAELFGYASTQKLKGSATQSFSTSSQDIGQDAILTKWNETDTDMAFLLEVSRDATNVGNPQEPSPGQPIFCYGSFQQNVDQLRAGIIDTLNVLESRTMRQEQRQYENVRGLTDKSVTTYTYESKTFTNGVLYNNAGADIQNCVIQIPSFLTPRTVLTFEEAISYQYPLGSEYPITMTRKWYIYNNLGVVTSVVSAEYQWDRGQWLQRDIQQQTGDPMGLVNSAVEFFNNAHQVQPTELGGTRNNPPQKTVIGKYQLRDGQRVQPIRLQRDPCALSQQGQLAKGFREASPLQVSCPHMDYDGLALIFGLCQTEQSLEQGNAYWDIVKITATLDTTPIVGESAIIYGASGIVDNIEHHINGDEGMTTITLRRIIKP